MKNVKGEIADVGFVLDTLFADLDEGFLHLTWRGLTPVHADDLADVKTVLVASEPLAEAPLPAEHYQGLLAAFAAEPLGIDERMPKGTKDRVAALEALAAEDLAQPDRDPMERTASILETKPDLFPEAARAARRGRAGASGRRRPRPRRRRRRRSTRR